jgi:hypothetical protein
MIDVANDSVAYSWFGLDKGGTVLGFTPLAPGLAKVIRPYPGLYPVF